MHGSSLNLGEALPHVGASSSAHHCMHACMQEALSEGVHMQMPHRAAVHGTHGFRTFKHMLMHLFLRAWLYTHARESCAAEGAGGGRRTGTFYDIIIEAVKVL